MTFRRREVLECLAIKRGLLVGWEDRGFISSNSAAEILSMPPETIRTWDKRGLIPTDRAAGKWRKFTREDVLRVGIASRSMFPVSDVWSLLRAHPSAIAAEFALGVKSGNETLWELFADEDSYRRAFARAGRSGAFVQLYAFRIGDVARDVGGQIERWMEGRRAR